MLNIVDWVLVDEASGQSSLAGYVGMASVPNGHAPIFSAVSSSARQLYSLLRCIGFAPKAQVQISGDGLRFAVEESRVMQG